MRKRSWLSEHPKPSVGVLEKLKKCITGIWLMLSMIIGWQSQWMAQEVRIQEREDDWKELVINAPAQMQSDTIITLDDATKHPILEPDPELNPEWLEDWDWEAWDEDQQELIKKSRISTHWMVWVWTWISGDFWEITSDDVTLTAVLDVTDQNTWLWVMAIRLDDFNNDPEHPVSKVTVLSPHWKKKFWEDWKFWINVELKKTFFDNNPSFNWIYPDVVLSYSANWWRTFEWMYAHRFMNWPDSDAFRLSISKRINDVLNLTWQFRYETWYDRNFYGRVTVDVDLWNGFLAQISWIAKYWKITPTLCIIRRF